MSWPIFFLIGILGLTPILHAEIIADHSAPGNQQPTIITAPNDIPLVNIQTPSDAGVSRNTYSKFDIEQSGAILNNSRSEVQTELGGWVQANPWLGDESARIILNEVNSLDPSLLRGYLEVAGDKAEVVIANPLGITCDGCGFINAQRSTLSTGIPILNVGALEGYAVRGGVVSIEGNGMDTRGMTYSEIIARATKINASIWANRLSITTGATDAVDTTPAFAIDMGQLGSMYSGHIFMVGTEAGFGVSNAGKMYAAAGDFVLDVDGPLENKDTGRIYGDQVSIDATGILNESVIAAREQLNIHVTDTVQNQENALLFSVGDLTLVATILNNESGTIEAQGTVDITAQTINNTNPDFRTKTEIISREDIREYQAADSFDRYLESTPGVRRSYKHGLYSLYLPDGRGAHESFKEYDYVRTVTETQIEHSVPGQILSGGDMSITANMVNNDKSRIVAGGNFIGTIGALNNTEVKGEHLITDLGVYTLYWRTSHLFLGEDSETSSANSYGPSPTIEPITLLAGEVGEGEANMTIPIGGLFELAPDPTMHYVIETDPDFANYRQWLSSEYFLTKLGLDINLTLKRLGDGFYEQQLIKEQALQLTGRRFLEDYTDDETQYQALMDSGISYAIAHNLSPGISLSLSQIAALTSDMVWLVEKEVRLPNGSMAKVLVPQLYVAARAGDVSGSGALIGGNNVNLQVSGDVMNSGTISGRGGLAITSDNLNNLRGNLSGQDVSLQAQKDLNNLGAVMAASNTLFVSAGKDLNMTASQVRNSGTGNTTLVAGNDLNLKTVTASRSDQLVWDEDNYQKSSSTTEKGSTIQTKGDLNLLANNDINIRAGTVTTEQGNLTARAGNDINLTAGENRVSTEQGYKQESGTLISKKTTKTRETFESNMRQGTTLGSGQGDVTLQAGRNYNQTGGNVIASEGSLSVEAQKVNIQEARDSSHRETKTTIKEVGFTGGVTTPVVTALQTAQNMRQAAKKAEDGRMAVLALANTGLVGSNALSALDKGKKPGSNILEQAGGVSAHVSFTKSKTELTSEVLEDSAQGAVLSGGKTVKIKASGDITAQGASIEGAEGVDLTAEGGIQLLAAKNTSQQNDKNKSQSQSLGVSADITGGVNATGTLSQSKGRSESKEVNWTNMQVVSDGKVTLISGGDTKLKGAVVKGQQVVAEVGGNLSIESLQDTSEYNSTQKSVSVSASVPVTGAGVASGSVNATNDSAHSQYASVTEQSGIEAGAGGFQIKTKGNTDLVGGLVASNEAGAENNQLSTGTLTHKDIKNIAEVDVDSRGIQLSNDMLKQGKYGAAKAVVTNAVAHSNETQGRSSETQSTLSAANISIETNPESLNTLNRDVTIANQTVEKYDVEEIKEIVQANRAIQDEAIKAITPLTDEAYRTLFQEHLVYEILRKESGEPIIDPETNKPTVRFLSAEEIKHLKPNEKGKVELAINGIFNDKGDAAKYAVEHTESTGALYFVHFPKANNAISELMIAGYQKFLENDLTALTSSTVVVKNMMTQYGRDNLQLKAHSRGSITVGNAMTSLEKSSKGETPLKGTDINLYGPAYNAQKAANQLDHLSGGEKSSVKLQNHEKDFVGRVLGGNEGTWNTIPEGSNTAKEWVNILEDGPTVHSCYGRGKEGCDRKYGNSVTKEIKAK